MYTKDQLNCIVSIISNMDDKRQITDTLDKILTEFDKSNERTEHSSSERLFDPSQYIIKDITDGISLKNLSTKDLLNIIKTISVEISTGEKNNYNFLPIWFKIDHDIILTYNVENLPNDLKETLKTIGMDVYANFLKEDHDDFQHYTEAAIKEHSFKAPYDGSRDSYDEDAAQHFKAGIEFALNNICPGGKNEAKK